MTPGPAERTGPTVTMSEVRQGAVQVMASTDGSVSIRAPDPCPDGVLLIGSFWQVESFPIEIVVSGSDNSGNTSYTYLTHTGDNDGLCERF